MLLLVGLGGDWNARLTDDEETAATTTTAVANDEASEDADRVAAEGNGSDAGPQDSQLGETGSEPDAVIEPVVTAGSGTEVSAPDGTGATTSPAPNTDDATGTVDTPDPSNDDTGNSETSGEAAGVDDGELGTSDPVVEDPEGEGPGEGSETENQPPESNNGNNGNDTTSERNFVGVLASVSGGQGEAIETRDRLDDELDTTLHILNTDDFASLNPGYWIVSLGPFTTPAEAQAACWNLGLRTADLCYIRPVSQLPEDLGVVYSPAP